MQPKGQREAKTVFVSVTKIKKCDNIDIFYGKTEIQLHISF